MATNVIKFEISWGWAWKNDRRTILVPNRLESSRASRGTVCRTHTRFGSLWTKPSRSQMLKWLCFLSWTGWAFIGRQWLYCYNFPTSDYSMKWSKLMPSKAISFSSSVSRWTAASFTGPKMLPPRRCHGRGLSIPLPGKSSQSKPTKGFWSVLRLLTCFSYAGF